jgi:hypothetical protein
MHITLTDGSQIKTAEIYGDPSLLLDKLVCSKGCPFFKVLNWDPANIMDPGKMTYRCIKTGHDFGYKESASPPHFVLIRTEDCVAKDPDSKVVDARKAYVESSGGLGTPRNMVALGYILAGTT